MILGGDIEFLLDGYSAVMWIFYGLTFAALLIMRITHSSVKRPYKVIFTHVL